SGGGSSRAARRLLRAFSRLPWGRPWCRLPPFRYLPIGKAPGNVPGAGYSVATVRTVVVRVFPFRDRDRFNPKIRSVQVVREAVGRILIHVRQDEAPVGEHVGACPGFVSRSEFLCVVGGDGRPDVESVGVVDDLVTPLNKRHLVPVEVVAAKEDVAGLGDVHVVESLRGTASVAGVLEIVDAHCATLPP